MAEVATLREAVTSHLQGTDSATLRNAAGVATVMNVSNFKKKLRDVLKTVRCKGCNGTMVVQEEVQGRRKGSTAKSMPVLEAPHLNPWGEVEGAEEMEREHELSLSQDLRAIMEEANICLVEEVGRSGGAEEVWREEGGSGEAEEGSGGVEAAWSSSAIQEVKEARVEARRRPYTPGPISYLSPAKKVTLTPRLSGGRSQNVIKIGAIVFPPPESGALKALGKLILKGILIQRPLSTLVFLTILDGLTTVKC